MQKENDFELLLQQIFAQDISQNVFTPAGALTGKEFPVSTAGKKTLQLSDRHTGRSGSFFKKPAVWFLLREDRCTLELIKKEQTYALSCLPDEYKEQMLFPGSKSGRDNEKMKEVRMTSVLTPCGNIAFKEACVIIECSLAQLAAAKPEDFYIQETKAYVTEAYEKNTIVNLYPARSRMYG